MLRHLVLRKERFFRKENKMSDIPEYYQFLYKQAKEGKIKAYLARNDKMQAKIKFCTKGKPTYIGEPFASVFYDCAEYIAGGFKKLYHAGCGYHAQ